MASRRILSLSLLLASAGWRPTPASAGEPKTLKPLNVVLGPSVVESAPRIDAPIQEVTVFSDRARVRRRGRAVLKGSASVIRLPDLPGAAFLDTIHVAATGARVVRVEPRPIERDRMEIGEAIKLLDELDAANDRATELGDRASLEQWEIDLLSRLAPEPQVPEEKREGRKGVALDVGSWWKALDFIAERTRAARGRLAALDLERRKLDLRRDRLRADIGTLDQGGFSARAVQVVAVLEAGAGGATAEVELEYFVPAASWKPSYDLHFSTARGQARLETAAIVQQATGEDWPEAAVAFSTATPGRGIDLPELLTWTLGERSEFLPRLRARLSPPVEPLYPPPVEPVAEGARAIDLEMVRARLAQAKNASVPASEEMTRNTIDMESLKRVVAEDMAVAGLQAQTVGHGYDRRRLAGRAARPAAAPASAPAPAAGAGRVASLELAGQEEDDALEESEGAVATEVVASVRRPRVTAMHTGSARRSGSAEVASKTGSPSPPPARRVALALFDRPPPSEAPRLSDPYLPAVSAGGFDFVYRAPTPVAVPSTGQQIRIPLSAQTFRTTAYYEATPALATTAFLRARVRNDGTRPLLRGPVAIFGDGELVGVGEIQTTGPSGEIELPLGADQDVRVVRQVVPSTKTTGLILKTDETSYAVQIQIGNYKKQPVSIEVTDQVPRSRNEKVEVKLVATDPKPLGDIDLDGTIRFRVDVPAGATRTVTLRYQITRPHDWELYQR